MTVSVLHGQLTIMTDDMDLAGDIIQALAQFLNLEDLLTTADFPVEIETLKQILIKVGWPRPFCLLRMINSKFSVNRYWQGT